MTRWIETTGVHMPPERLANPDKLEQLEPSLSASLDPHLQQERVHRDRVANDLCTLKVEQMSQFALLVLPIDVSCPRPDSLMILSMYFPSETGKVASFGWGSILRTRVSHSLPFNFFKRSLALSFFGSSSNDFS